MSKFLEEKEAELAAFHQCRFGLRSASGELHRKATKIATSSSELHGRLHGLKCLRNHTHAHVIGGSRITSAAGLYPRALARTLVQGMEAQFERDHPRAREVLAAEGQDEGEHGEDDEAPALLPLGSESEEEEMQVPDLQVPAAVKEAVRKLHENTGHRSNRRLARALAISGAPAQAIVAAKRLKCAICDEKRQPKTRRPATLPVPKDVSDQVHVDIFEAVDALGRNFYVR